MAHFEQEDDPSHPKYNGCHPATNVTEALRTIGIRFIDPGIKKGADDMEIKEILKEVAIDFSSRTSEVCVVLIANDKDFAHEVWMLFII